MKRLLVVDDEPAVLQPMTRYFARMGYDVTAARDKEEALSALASTPFDLVILDLRLGDSETDGLDILHQARERRARLPVLVLSGIISASVRAEVARGAGAALQKPQALPEIARVAAALIAAAGQPASTQG
jgi:DNA-binding response OmpR family regulator